MTHIVTLSRPLPLPQITAAEEPVTFQAVAAVSDIPEGTQVHCTTALDPLTAEAIEALPDSVRLIANIGVGVDNIALAAAAARGIAVSNTPVVTEDTADLCFALILAACRKLGENERFVRAGKWGPDAMMAAMGTRVHGKTLGLIGMGPIAQAVARRAQGFNMPLVYWNRTRRLQLEADLGLSWADSPDDLVQCADIVSLHCALTSDTKHIINGDRLAQFREGAVLVNTARGPLVDEAALVIALTSGRLGAAGLDVFADEPSLHPGLSDLENAVLTPHTGSATGECRTDMVRRALGNIVAFIENGAPVDPV